MRSRYGEMRLYGALSLTAHKFKICHGDQCQFLSRTSGASYLSVRHAAKWRAMRPESLHERFEHVSEILFSSQPSKLAEE